MQRGVPAISTAAKSMLLACLYRKRGLKHWPVIDYIQKGGLLMWPILVCSIIAIAVFAERFFYLHRATIHVGEFLKGLFNLIQRRNFAEALHESAGTPGPVARVIHAAILRHDAPRSELREIVQEAGQLEVPKLERFLGVLATIAFLAPLLGLLGTVAGMIEAFGMITSHGGYATVTELSGGVYKSLLTTAAGLVVATPTFVAYSYLSSRVNTMLHEMERAGIEIVHMLKDSEALTSIISFQAPSEKAASEREVSSRPSDR
jgi:biopolymer transport protein ExbB